MSWSLTIFSKIEPIHIALFVASLALAACITYALRFLMPKAGMVCRPSNDRWSRNVVPLGGGIALYLVSAAFLYQVSIDLWLACTAIFILGIIDDRKSLPASAKLVVQTIAACWLVASPNSSDISVLIQSGFWEITAKILILILLANSFNLLDNVDGSAAGVCAISLGILVVLSLGTADSTGTVVLAAIALGGACVGFLTQNFPPAKIFMGDAGSLFLGFTLAALYFALPEVSLNPAMNYVILFFVVGTSLFDTALVWFTRWSIQRPFLKGGKDHVAHRLIALGLSERKTLMVIYGVTAALGGVALGLAKGNITTSGVLATTAGTILVFLGLYLGEVPVYFKDPEFLPRRRTFRGFLFFGIELLLDILMIASAWILAWIFRFDDPLMTIYLKSSGLVAIPMVIAIKVAVLFTFRLYRGVWWSIQFNDLSRIALATVTCTALVFLVVSFSSFVEINSRGVLAIDMVLTFLFIAGNRSALRFFRQLTASFVNHQQRAILVGPKEVESLLELNAEYRRMYKLVGSIPASASHQELLLKAKECEAEVALIADGIRDPSYTGHLAESGIGLRHLSVILE